MLNFNMCVCGGGGGGRGVGGYFYVVDLYNAIFFEFRVKHQTSFLPNKQNLEEHFHRQNFNANILI